MLYDVIIVGGGQAGLAMGYATGETIIKTAPDQIAILGTLESGTVITAHYQGGVARGENLRWTFRGSEGELVIISGSGQVNWLTI